MTTLGLQINDRIVCSVHFGLWTSDKRRRRTIGSYWSYGYSTHDSEKYYCVCGYVELGVILRIAFTIGAVVVVRICCQWSGTCHSDTFHSPPKGAEERQLTVEECTKDDR